LCFASGFDEDFISEFLICRPSALIAAFFDSAAARRCLPFSSVSAISGHAAVRRADRLCAHGGFDHCRLGLWGRCQEPRRVVALGPDRRANAAHSCNALQE
jgi:hypothetical protein